MSIGKSLILVLSFGVSNISKDAGLFEVNLNPY
jgi:hypothetical protein